MRVILIPGWNEGADGMDVFIRGRGRRPGLEAAGFDCTTFDGGTGSLRSRIGQFAGFLSDLGSKSRGEKVALFGYSAGGIIARGLLRAYPRSRVAAIFQLATPNAGLVTEDPWSSFRRLHFDGDVIDDLDIESPFMRWLNGTGGHWENDAANRTKRWRLNAKPWTMVENVPLLNLIGSVPRYRSRSDGVVRVESGSLDDYIPCEVINAKNANHLNLGGTWNPLTLVLRAWRRDDVLWPQAVAASTQLFRRAQRPVE